LAADFGYVSSIAKRAIRKFYEKLKSPRSDKTKVLFNEWYELVSQAYPISGEELRKVADLYGFKKREIKNVDGVKLFYAIQTYYALILKILAAETASRFYDSVVATYIMRLREVVEDPEELREQLRFLENGSVYMWYGISNFLEGEFFSWYLDEWDEDIYDVVRGIIDKLSQYDIEALTLDLTTARDMFKILYEELVPRKEVRQKLGFYTTPDWLAELTLREMGITVKKFLEMKRKGKDPLDLRFLDPGVGTGTFLTIVIQLLGRYLRDMHESFVPSEEAKEALKKITRNVIGFDIDAIAVLTARTNYLIALAVTELLQHKGGESIEIPIYMANSMVTAEELKDTELVVLPDGKAKSVEVAKVSTIIDEFRIPIRLIREGIALELLSEIRRAIEDNGSESSIIDGLGQKHGLADAEIKVLKDLYKTLAKLEEKGVDKIWIPVIKSHIVSLMFKEKFDYVIGNPPWLAYRYITSPKYQLVIKSLIKDQYQLVLDEHLMTHMEMATLFFVRCIDLYLKDGGLIGFVMPRAIFAADQHDRFRRGLANNVKYGILKIIDCESVDPLFYVPTCSLIARKNEETKYPIDAVVVEGKLPEDIHKVIHLEKAITENLLNVISERKLYLNTIGARSFLDYEELKFRNARSDYYEDFYQGATIVPQLCWFVDIIDASHPEFVVVKTAKRAKVRGKIKEEIKPLPIERNFIYGALTSAEVLPFCHLPPNIVVLPIIPDEEGYRIIKKKEANQMGEKHLAKWLEEVEKIWQKIRGEKKQRMDVYERINYQRLLTKQNLDIEFIFVYLRSGTDLTACLVQRKLIMENNITLNGIVIESTLYWCGLNNEDEGCYLSSIFNSNILNRLIKPLQSKGVFGERDIHKKPLEFPIPKFNPKNSLHKKLSKLGKKASEKAWQILPKLLVKFGYDKKLKNRGCLMPQEIARLRGALREELKDTIKEIDKLVIELFKQEGTTITRETKRVKKSKKSQNSMKPDNKKQTSLDKFYINIE